MSQPLGTVVLTQIDLERLADAAAQRVVASVAAEEAAGEGDDSIVVVRLTRGELRQVREAGQFYARAGYALSFLEKLGKWLAAVAALGVFVKMMFPHFFNGGPRP